MTLDREFGWGRDPRRLNNTYLGIKRAVTSIFNDLILYERYTYNDDAHPTGLGLGLAWIVSGATERISLPV
jgi:hypothetical protein